MSFRKILGVGVCLLAASVLTDRASAQSTSACTENQAQAVRCFVANAVTTKMTSPRYGMTLPEFEQYGVVVFALLQTHHTYLTLVGISSAIADAMPPTNSNGSANQAAQDLAVEKIVSAAVSNNLATPFTGVTTQDMQWFSLDMVSAMNDNNGYMSLMTPGVGLRIVDSYVVTATSGSTVNWTLVDASIANAVTSFIKSGLIKVPSGVTTDNVTAFLQATAKAIDSYKVSTGRKSL